MVVLLLRRVDTFRAVLVGFAERRRLRILIRPPGTTRAREINAGAVDLESAEWPRSARPGFVKVSSGLNEPLRESLQLAEALDRVPQKLLSRLAPDKVRSDSRRSLLLEPESTVADAATRGVGGERRWRRMRTVYCQSGFHVVFREA